MALIIAVVLIPIALPAAFEHESILRTEIGAPILDVATNPADDLIFVLTSGAVLIYSTDDRTVLDRIPLKASYDRIAFQKDDRLILTATKPSQINIIRFSRIFDIELAGRAVKGPKDAKVTLVVFDDYQ
jgi:hypothetical protein